VLQHYFKHKDFCKSLQLCAFCTAILQILNFELVRDLKIYQFGF